LLVPATKSYYCFLGNWNIRFWVPDHPIFLSENPAVLLVADVSVTAVSDVVASIAKTLSGS
jgi:hypothetical protein